MHSRPDQFSERPFVISIWITNNGMPSSFHDVIMAGRTPLRSIAPTFQGDLACPEAFTIGFEPTGPKVISGL